MKIKNTIEYSDIDINNNDVYEWRITYHTDVYIHSVPGPTASLIPEEGVDKFWWCYGTYA